MKIIKVAVLGEGVTGKSVNAALERIPGYQKSPVEKADLIVASPGIPPRQFPTATGEFISEIEFAYRLFRRPGSRYCPKLIAVTGTNGKSTVTALIAHLMQIPFSGNIGVPLIDFVDKTDAPEWLVVELSSYQLELCFHFRPEVAVLLNITPDHFERHGTIEEYARQKANIFRHQTAEDFLLYYDDQGIVMRLVENASSTRFCFSETDLTLLKGVNHQLVGAHNEANILAALGAVRLAGLSKKLALKRLATFAPLEHRIEPAGTVNGVRYYNDSKSTTPDSTEKAVMAFKEPVHVLLCGVDKKLDFTRFLNWLHGHVKSITVFGHISEMVRKHYEHQKASVPIFVVANLDEALQSVSAVAKRGEVVLFSPSSASFDQFKNFEDRGRIFKSLVEKMKGYSA